MPIAVDTTLKVTPAQATSASSSMSPEQASLPSPPAAGCRPASTVAQRLVMRQLVPLGINVAFTPLGILVALTFISLPFVVRTVQPVLEDLEAELEEAATCLGATRWQIFSRVLFPAVLPALLTGFTLAFARATGEFGSVIFIAGNIPMVSEIAPLLIIGKLEQFDFLGATAIAVVMLVISCVMLFAINLIQWWSSRRHGMTR